MGRSKLCFEIMYFCFNRIAAGVFDLFGREEEIRSRILVYIYTTLMMRVIAFRGA